MNYVKKTFIDANDSMISINNNIKDYVSRGDFATAELIAKNNINIIGERPNADYFNSFENAIVELEELLFVKKKFIYNTTEIPKNIEVGQIWLGGEL